MTRVGVETMKDRFGDYLQRARDGEKILITEQGRDVALLTSVDEKAPARRALDLVESGVAEWSGGKPAGSKRRPQIRGKSAAAIVLEDRR